MSRDNDSLPLGCGLLAAAVIVAAIAFGFISASHEADVAGCTVTDKDRTSSDSSSDMRVYTSCGVFKVSDSLLSTRWNSSDVYAGIRVGATYDLHTRGYRLPFLSRFPNIITATEVTR